MEKARMKLSHTAFVELFEDGVEIGLSSENPHLYQGYRVTPIDGSLVLLPNTKEVRECFGVTTPVKGSMYARISGALDVLNGFLIDADIQPFTVGERAMALRHIEKINIANAMYLFDRGYWSPEIVAKICDKGQKFVMRLASNACPEVTKNTCNSGKITLEHNGKSYSLRYFKFELPSGEMEYLLTNVSEDEIDDESLKELYAMRWGIETKYRELKSFLQLENFTGKKVEIIKQDFFATVLVSNMAAFAALASDELIQEEIAEKQLSRTYETNKNFVIGALKDTMVKILIEDDPLLRSSMLDKLKNQLSKHKTCTNRIRVNNKREHRKINESKKRKKHTTKMSI